MDAGYGGLRYSFICPNPKCHEQFEETISRLAEADTVSCPECGTTIDISESKRTGDLARIVEEGLEEAKDAAVRFAFR